MNFCLFLLSISVAFTFTEDLKSIYLVKKCINEMESNMKWVFRWMRLFGNDACFYNRKRVIRGKGKRGGVKAGGDGRWR